MPKLFDDMSDAIIVRLLDAAEEWLVASGKCPAEQAHAWLTRDYLACAAGRINGATCYVMGDEHGAASYFLSCLPGAGKELNSTKRAAACAKMLFENPARYFPHYGAMLAYFFDLEIKRTHPRSLHMNGIIHLGAATLPGARARIRRENRQRDGYEWTVVADEDMERRLLKESDMGALLFRGVSNEPMID